MTNEEKARELANNFSLSELSSNPVSCVNDACLEAMKWKEQQMIEKVCEWLKNNAGEHIYFDECDNEWYDTEELIEDFKQAMEK